MGLFDKLFKQTNKGTRINASSTNSPEQAVIITFNYRLDDLSYLHSLEDKLDSVLGDLNVGDCDGHEIATDLSDGLLYLYGSNAESLFKAIKPTLESTDFLVGAKAKLRFGPPEDGVKEIEIIIGDN
ncbi:MAG: hypothetical protein ACJ77K_18790 [Bacteroidia bacterium]|jgi:hypothetical protein